MESRLDRGDAVRIASDHESRRGRAWTWGPFLSLTPAIVFWIQGIATGRAVNLFESGTAIVGGDRILGGEVPYADFFAFYGPLTYVLPALSVRVTGSVIIGQFGYDLLIACLTSLVSYLIARRISDRPLLALLVPFSLALLGGTTARCLAALVAILFLGTFERRYQVRWLVACGAAVAVAGLWIQDSGAWVTVAILVVALTGIWWPGPRRVLGFGNLLLIGAGASALTIPFAVYLAVRGGFTDWIYWTFVFPNTGYTERDATGYLSSMISAWSGESLVTIMYRATFYLLPYLIVLVAALGCIFVAFARARRPAGSLPIPVATAVLAVYSLLQLRVLAASLDDQKLADVVSPVITCAIALALAYVPAGAMSKNLKAYLSPKSIIAILLTAWFLIWPMQKAAASTQNHGVVPSHSSSGSLAGLPLSGAVRPDTTVRELEELRAAVESRTSPGDPILVLPTSPLLYTIVGRSNATQFDYLDPVYTTDQVDQEIARALIERRPQVVVVANNPFPGSDLTGEQIAPATYRALRDEYVVEAHVGAQWQLYTARQP